MYAVWLVAAPAAVIALPLVVLGGFYMPAIPIFLALSLTLSILDRPGFPAAAIGFAFLGQLVCYAIVLAVYTLTPTPLSRGLGGAALMVGGLIAVVLPPFVLWRVWRYSRRTSLPNEEL